MKVLDSFLQWRVVRGKKSATITCVELDSPEEVKKYLANNGSTNRFLYIAKLTPVPASEIAEDLPQGFGADIKEAAEHLAVRLEEVGKGYLLEQ